MEYLNTFWQYLGYPSVVMDNLTAGTTTTNPDHIDAFFARYPRFDYNPSSPIWAEFDRMCDRFRWRYESDERRDARDLFREAIVEQFNSLYGTDVNDLGSWQNLCHILNIVPVPDSLKYCREVIKRTHVNLVDLVDTQRTGEAVKVFRTVEELRQYTRQNRKIFPRDEAKAGGLLRYLLRKIFAS
ncbi:hypothetical protein F5884DRAFT_825056 [Xylogone sp. PMI_703]|nr:hypothetical protein F5884DRAFT_825056 [Xylogone sp. PMI_703]